MRRRGSSEGVLQPKLEGGRAVLSLEGALHVEESLRLHEALLRLEREGGASEVVVDFARLKEFDSAGIAVLSVMAERLKKRGKVLRLENLSESHREALALMPAFHGGFGKPPKPAGALELLGGRVLEGSRDVANYIKFCGRLGVETFRVLFMGKRSARGELMRQAVTVGVDAFPVIALTSVLIGVVLGFQAAHHLTEFGGVEYVANLVGVGMARSFGPLMTAVVLSGRSGSAMAAELGTMKVQEELDALRVMGLDPERYLALPRLFAMLMMGPALTLLSILLGILGGMMIGVFYVGVTPTFYIYRTLSAVEPIDLWHGLWKSEVFAFLIASIAIYCGMQMQGGASGVGKATTKAVVMGIFMIIFADAIGTGLSTIFKGVF